VPVFGIALVSIEQRVRPIRLGQLTVAYGFGQPSVIRLASKLENPTRDRDGDTVGGQLTGERVEPFPGKFACDKYAAARRSTSFSCSRTRLRLRRSRSSADSAAVDRAGHRPRSRPYAARSANRSVRSRNLRRSA